MNHVCFFFFNDTATTEIYPLPLHDALPIYLYGMREPNPLYALLGAEAREIPAYGSGVDLPKPLDGLLRQTEGFLERGFPGVKVKIGRPDPHDDEQRVGRSEEHTSELQSRQYLVCRLLLE